jgi:transposase-like protein
VGKWKKHYFRLTIRDWRRVVERSGLEGLTRQGGIQFDRGPRIDARDKLKRLELQVRYLRAENDFLAELRAKRAESNSGRTKNTGSSGN